MLSFDSGLPFLVVLVSGCEKILIIIYLSFPIYLSLSYSEPCHSEDTTSDGGVHDGLYNLYPAPPKDDPEFRFILEFPCGFSNSQISSLLKLAVKECSGTEAVGLVTSALQDSVIYHTYGPTIRSIIDHHGHTIRTAGSKESVMEALEQCQCRILFPQFVDPEVGHVRTQESKILGPVLGPLVAKGMNFRPALRTNTTVLLNRVLEFARRVLTRARVCDKPRILRRLETHIKMSQIMQSGEIHRAFPYLWQLEKAAVGLCNALTCTSTDKAANTCTIECSNWYRAVCLNRLLSPAFTALGPAQESQNQLQILERWAPWACNQEFEDAILFATAKMHKRSENNMAYRYITSACSALSRPVSIELTRILTFLSAEMRQHCVVLGQEHGAKFWWSVNSLDVVPFNIGSLNVKGRQLSAFDLDRCFESVPLLDGPYSLLKHVEFFLECVFSHSGSSHVNSELHHLTDEPSSIAWGDGGAPLSYTIKEILGLLSDLLSMTIVSVGDTRRIQDCGIPMGFNSSVCLLNIYMFKPEFEFTWRLLRLQPQLAFHTHLIFRYVDDVGNFSGLNLRLYLDPLQAQDSDNPFWIYPIEPLGPLSITDQTERGENYTKVIYLDVQYVDDGHRLSFTMYCKSDSMPFKVRRYTHWNSQICQAAKLGMIKSQTRSACRAASTTAHAFSNLATLCQAFTQNGFPEHLVLEKAAESAAIYLQRFPSHELS